MNNGKIERTGKAFKGKSQLKNKINNFIAETFDERSKIKTNSKNHMIVLNNKNSNLKNNFNNENIYDSEENKNKKIYFENQKFELTMSRPPTQNIIKRNSTPFAPGNKADKNFYSANDVKIQELFDSKKLEKESNFYKFNSKTNPKYINDLIPFNDVYKKNKQMIYLSANIKNIKNGKVKVNTQDINHNFFLNLNDYDIFDFKKKPLTADYTQKKVGLQKGQNQLILERLKQKYMMENEKKNNKAREIYTPDVSRTNMNMKMNNINDRKNKSSENFFKGTLNHINNNNIHNKIDENNKKLENDSSLKNLLNRDDFINYSNLKKEEKKTSCLKIFKIQNEINNKKNSEQVSNIFEKNTDENMDYCKLNDVSFSKGKDFSDDNKNSKFNFENNLDKFKFQEKSENIKNTFEAINEKIIIKDENKLHKHKSLNGFSNNPFNMKEGNKSLKTNQSQENLQKIVNDKNEMTDNFNNLDKFLNKNFGDPNISKTKNQNNVDSLNEKAENIQREIKDQYKISIENFVYKNQDTCDSKNEKNLFNNINIDEANNLNNKNKIKNQKSYNYNIVDENDLKMKKRVSSDKSLFEFNQDDILILKHDKNLSLEINDTDGNIKILESRKNKNNFNIIEDKFVQENFNKKNANNNLINFNSLNCRLKSSKEKIKENMALNFDIARKESISPSRKEHEKKLIFVKSNESITLNKLNEISFANENNLGFSNKNFLKEQNSIASNRSSLNTDNKYLFNRKSVETIKNVNRNEDEYNKFFVRNCEIENEIDNNEESDKNNNVFDLLNKNPKENNNYSKHTFRNGDESDYKIELETSKIFNDLKINSNEDDIFNNNDFFKSEEDQRFGFKKYNKNEERNLNMNLIEKEDIKIESEKYSETNNLFFSNNNNYKNNFNYDFRNKIEIKENEEKTIKNSINKVNNVFFNNTNNNFSKFNNLNNNNSNNLKGNNIQINPKSQILNNNKNTLNNNLNCHNSNSQLTNQNYEYNNNLGRPPSFKVEEISNIMKRVLENNKKEAAAKSREFLKNYPQNYFNLAKTQTVFFAEASQGSRTERPSTDHRKTRPHFDTVNFLEINLYDQPAWKKHEEIWDILKNNKNENQEESENPIDKTYEENKKTKKNKVINLNVDQKSCNKYSQLIEKEKFLIPPNDEEVLISAYYKLYNINGKFIIDDNLQFPKEEINKWKNAYKKTVMRWHPDKLTHFIDSLELKDEYNKNSIVKKAGVIIYHMNKNLKNIVEVLKNISIKQENRRTGNNN